MAKLVIPSMRLVKNWKFLRSWGRGRMRRGRGRGRRKREPPSMWSGRGRRRRRRWSGANLNHNGALLTKQFLLPPGHSSTHFTSKNKCTRYRLEQRVGIALQLGKLPTWCCSDAARRHIHPLPPQSSADFHPTVAHAQTILLKCCNSLAEPHNLIEKPLIEDLQLSERMRDGGYPSNVKPLRLQLVVRHLQRTAAGAILPISSFSRKASLNPLPRTTTTTASKKNEPDSHVHTSQTVHHAMFPF